MKKLFLEVSLPSSQTFIQWKVKYNGTIFFLTTEFLGTVSYSKDDLSKIVVSDFYYPSPGPDAFFWAGEDTPGCDEKSIENLSYNLTPGKLGSKFYFDIAL